MALVLALVPWVTNTLRLYVWSRFFGEKTSPLEMLKITIGADLGAAISPTAVGGGYFKVAMLLERGFSPGVTASVLALLTAEDIAFFLVALPAAITSTSAFEFRALNPVFRRFKHFIHMNPYFLAALSAGIIIIFLLIRLGIFRKFFRISFLRKAHDGIAIFGVDFKAAMKFVGRRGKFLFLINFLLSAIQWICRYSVITALVACFNVPVHPIRFFLFQWIVFTFMTFTPTPGGSVGAEASFYLTYRNLIPDEILGLATAAWRFMTYYFQLSLGTILFSLIHFHIIPSRKPKRKNHQTKEIHKTHSPTSDWKNDPS